MLFADLVGFTSRAERMDPEDVRRLLAPYWNRLRDELEHYGGTVEKFIGDAVMAVFGAPRAHEDDPERAVRAAPAIRDWALAEEQELQLRIGIASGEALVAVDARPAEGEGIASGDVVNTAARLQSAAPVNGIVVGQATFRATAHVIDYHELEPVEVKGKAEPVAVWEALEARSRVAVELARPSTPLVGRRRELAQLFDAFDRAREERAPQLVTVVGVPGIGKSRLVGELFARVEADPDFINWRQGRSLPYGEGVAFSALADMVKAETGILDSDAAEAAAEKLAGSLEPLPVETRERDWIEQSLRPLLGMGGEARSGDRRAESFAAWRRYFEARAELRPHVLVFEDLHWADDDLLDFVDELTDWIEDAPLLVLCTARPELLERRPGWGGGKRNALTISLAPLSEEDTARLIGQLLERPLLPAHEQAELLARIGGNPVFAEQFVRMSAERGRSELPETLHGLIAARLDSLSQTEKALLQDAAVFGRVFWRGALGEGLELESRLQQLVRKEFIRRDRRSVVGGETEYSFAHALVRDVAYGQIPHAQRAQRHEQAAAWIESFGADRLEDRADQAAHHLLTALDLRRAAGLETAGLEARARANLQGAIQRFLVDGRQEQAAEAEITCAYLAWLGGLGDDADRHLERAVELVRDLPDSPAKAAVLTERARRLMLRGDYERARPACAEAIAVAEALGLQRRKDEVLATLGAMILGDEGERVLREGIEIASETHDLMSLARAYNNLGEHKLRAGEFAGVGAWILRRGGGLGRALRLARNPALELGPAGGVLLPDRRLGPRARVHAEASGRPGGGRHEALSRGLRYRDPGADPLRARRDAGGPCRPTPVGRSLAGAVRPAGRPSGLGRARGGSSCSRASSPRRRRSRRGCSRRGSSTGAS